MITKLLVMGLGIGWFVLTVIIAIWWRSKFIYIYFGENSMFSSWYGTLVGSFIAAGLIVGILGYPITWLDTNCPYLLDIVAIALIAYAYFGNKNGSGGNSGENSEDVAPTNGNNAEIIANEEKGTVANNDELVANSNQATVANNSRVTLSSGSNNNSNWIEKNKKALIIVGVVALVGVAGMSMTGNGDSKKQVADNRAVVQNTVQSNNKAAMPNPSSNNSNPNMNTTTPVKKKNNNSQTKAPQVLFAFHQNITNRNYRQAYNCLSDDFKNEVGYEGWVAGFKTTVSSKPTNVRIVSKSNNRVELSYTLEAVDNPGGTKYFNGTAILINTPDGWKIDDLINKVL